MRVLIDGDIFRYQFGSVEMAHPLLIGEFVPASSDYVRHLVDSTIAETMRATGADDYVIAISGAGNFRNEVATLQPYKGNRNPNLTRPHHYDTVGHHILDNHPHVVVDGMEADDWLGIEQRKAPHETCIASRDKDLLGIMGYHYRFACGNAQPAVPMHWVSLGEAEHFFFYQMLIGDATDNIPGCGKKELRKWGKTKVECYNGTVLEVPHWMKRRKGVGVKEALKILSEGCCPSEWYDLIAPQYKKIYGDIWEEAMLENARLLYIGQTPDNLFTWDVLGISTSEVNIICNQI
ncbi:MAG: hypothetical protein ACRC6V_17040 [Bacteroidales bacterium]